MSDLNEKGKHLVKVFLLIGYLIKITLIWKNFKKMQMFKKYDKNDINK